MIRAVAQVEGVRLEVHGPASSPLEEQHRAELERLVVELQAPVELGAALPREELPALFARSDLLINNMRAGAPDKVVYEAAASCLPVIASNPIFDEFLDPFPREDVAELAKRLRAFAALPAAERGGDRPRAARGRRRAPLRRVLGRQGAGRVKPPLVLHMQKVAGISGSEAHLLSLLPDLRGRGWDIRLLMLHEDEPGAWDFARELEARGVPVDAIHLSADVDPLAFAKVSGYLARSRPTVLHTHLVHADAYGQVAGAMTASAGRLLDEARLQRVPRGPRLRVRRPHGREPGPRPDRDLARARALPRRHGGLRRGELRDRPLRDRAARRRAARARARRACSAWAG